MQADKSVDHNSSCDCISPIMKLSHDLMRLIFALNADMDNPLEYDSSRNDSFFSRPSALDTTRRTSQVCRYWRDVLLESPSIWGQVIRLDRFKRKRNEKWRSEVMRRTGNGGLCIKGEVQSDILDLSAFFVELLRTDWSRIKKFDCRIGGKGISETTLRRLFSRPAPSLESFTIIFGERQKLEMAEDQLFSSDSPLLQKLITCRMTFSLPRLWTTDIRHLKLEEGQFNPTHLLRSIRQMPLLEYLELSNISPSAAPQETDSESVNLPNLTDLRLTTPLHFGLAIADSINPAADCRLHWDSHRGLATITDHDMTVACRILGRYSNTSFSTRVPTSLVLDIDERSFRFETTPISPKPLLSRLLGFDQLVYPTTFSVHLISLFPLGFSAALINSLSYSNFHAVTEFRFDPDPSSNLKNTLTKIDGLFTALVSIDALMVSDYGLQILLEYSEGAEIIFPLLRLIELSQTRATASSFLTILPFLEFRQSRGFPIQVLNLTTSPTGNWRFLEKFNGLTVIWTTKRDKKKYICGSGDEKQLHMRDWDSDEDMILNYY